MWFADCLWLLAFIRCDTEHLSLWLVLRRRENAENVLKIQSGKLFLQTDLSSIYHVSYPYDCVFTVYVIYIHCIIVLWLKQCNIGLSNIYSWRGGFFVPHTSRMDSVESCFDFDSSVDWFWIQSKPWFNEFALSQNVVCVCVCAWPKRMLEVQTLDLLFEAWNRQRRKKGDRQRVRCDSDREKEHVCSWEGEEKRSPNTF